MEEMVLAKDVSVYDEPDITLNPIFCLPSGTKVHILQKNDVWCKISCDYISTGYVRRKSLGMLSDRTSNIMISIPRDCAVSLYEALKYSLNK